MCSGVRGVGNSAANPLSGRTCVATMPSPKTVAEAAAEAITGSSGPCFGSPSRGEPLIVRRQSDQDTLLHCLTMMSTWHRLLYLGVVHA